MKPVISLFFAMVWLAVLQLPLAADAHELSPEANPGCARYLGNEGIMVTSGDTRILFDAFYADSYGQYALVPDATRQALIEGRKPYANVDAVFVSHVHGDHFTPAPTLAFLRANPSVPLYASRQVIDALLAAGADDAMLQRLHAFTLAAGDPAQSASVGSIDIAVVRIPHAGGQRTENIENLAFRVTLNDSMTVLHLGDADSDDSLFAPHQAHWDAQPLDAAFPPYWFLGSAAGQSILDQRLKPARTIGIHVPIAAAGSGDAWRTRLGGDLFTDPGEIRGLTEAGCGSNR